MNTLSFSELQMPEPILKAIREMGFENATDIQAQAIPVIQTGSDVIGKSQTGTGKTIAFGIPALQKVDTGEEKNTLQVLILCPTRELAQQAGDELRKLSAFMHGIRIAEVYGGVSMDRQIVRLKKANIVVGTPGRIMDHMRRRTLKVNHIKMVVLDEADEMLNMGFKEDIETILTDTPQDRQTVLFSATMPPAILAITREFQTDPELIEIDRKKVTLDNIEQFYVEVPLGRKLDALHLLLRYHRPNLSMIFCNTKKMVDEVTEFLQQREFMAEGIHGDMKQLQRTRVMDSFKAGRTNILVATDVAARGIDVNDIDYVINYDIPQNNEYYVHRIGRTGRAGKSGKAITLCGGKRQTYTIRDIGRLVKSVIEPLSIPNMEDIREKSRSLNLTHMEEVMAGEPEERYTNMVNDLLAKGFSLHAIAAKALELHFGKQDEEITEVASGNAGFAKSGGGYRKISISIGRNARVAPNHIVGALAEQTGLSGREIGKIEIYENETVAAVPAGRLDEVLQAMTGCKILGRATTTKAVEGHAFDGKPQFNRTPRTRGNFAGNRSVKNTNRRKNY